MSLQINVHRNWDHTTMERMPWQIDFHDHESFAVVKITCGNDSVTFFDEDIAQFVVALEAAWYAFHAEEVSDES